MWRIERFGVVKHQPNVGVNLSCVVVLSIFESPLDVEQVDRLLDENRIVWNRFDDLLYWIDERRDEIEVFLSGLDAFQRSQRPL